MVKESNKPFGGILVMAVGDFYQTTRSNSSFVFQSKEWNDTIQLSIGLKHIMRQHGDTTYQAFLHRARIGQVSAEDISYLHSTYGTKTISDSEKLQLFYIYSNRTSIRDHNEQMSKYLSNSNSPYLCLKSKSKWKRPSPQQIYWPGIRNPYIIQKHQLSKDWSIPIPIPKFGDPMFESIELKYLWAWYTYEIKCPERIYKGSRIQMTAASATISKGERGTVIGWDEQNSSCPKLIISFDNGMEVAIEQQIQYMSTHDNYQYVQLLTFPITLAFAIHYNDIQTSLPSMAIVADLATATTTTTEYGQLYTAFGKVSNPSSGLYLIRNVSNALFKVNPKVKHFEQSMLYVSDQQIRSWASVPTFKYKSNLDVNLISSSSSNSNSSSSSSSSSRSSSNVISIEPNKRAYTPRRWGSIKRCKIEFEDKPQELKKEEPEHVQDEDILDILREQVT